MLTVFNYNCKLLFYWFYTQLFIDTCDLLLQLTTPGSGNFFQALYSTLIAILYILANNYFAEYALCKEGISMANLVNPRGQVSSTYTLKSRYEF